MLFMQPNLIITDGQLRELAVHGPKKFPIQYYLDDTQDYCNQKINRHWHRECELAVIREGEIDCLIGDENVHVRNGDGIFINAGMIHGFKAENRTVMPNIVFSPELISSGNQTIYEKFIQPIICSQISYLHLAGRIDWQGDILRSLNRIFHFLNSAGETKEIDVQIELAEVWRTLFLHQNDCTILPQTANSHIVQVRLRLMLEFIYENYANRVSLMEIASAANISKSEALRCFKVGADTSPVDYLIQFRLNKARELLVTTEFPITEIAAAAGFENVGYFDRIFKKAFGVTPKYLQKYSHGNR